MKSVLQFLGVALVLLTPALPVALATENKVLRVSASDFGDKWPLTVSEGLLGCSPAGRLQAVTFETAAGIIYAVNGTAKSSGFPPIEEIWRPDPRPEFATFGLRVNIGPLLDLGLKLCSTP